MGANTNLPSSSTRDRDSAGEGEDWIGDVMGDDSPGDEGPRDDDTINDDSVDDDDSIDGHGAKDDTSEDEAVADDVEGDISIGEGRGDDGVSGGSSSSIDPVTGTPVMDTAR